MICTGLALSEWYGLLVDSFDAVWDAGWDGFALARFGARKWMCLACSCLQINNQCPMSYCSIDRGDVLIQMSVLLEETPGYWLFISNAAGR